MTRGAPVEPRSGAIDSESDSGTHRVAIREWGPANAARCVVCVHGLTGCARDFDVLAAALAGAGYRVVCPDVVGRGDSDRLADPDGYQLKQYVRDMRALLAQLDLRAVDWVGTSMGGLIGMALSGRPDTPIRRLVLNDIGPFVPSAALLRLGEHLGQDPIFPDLVAAEVYLRRTRAPFGPLTDAQWRAMAERTTRRAETGGYRLHYDPAVALRFRESMHEDLDLWRVWDAIECPVVVLRGGHSDLLIDETARQMTKRGPGATLIEFEECGHHPALLERHQNDPIVDWLLADGDQGR